MEILSPGFYKVSDNTYRIDYGLDDSHPLDTQMYDIKVVYKKTSNAQPSSNVRLEWKPGIIQNRHVVPSNLLYLPDNPKPVTPGIPENGLLATYYNIKSNYINSQYWQNWPGSDAYPKLNKDHSLNHEMLDEGVNHYVNNINFDWGAGSPDYHIGADYFVSEWNGKIVLHTQDNSSVTKSFEFITDNGGILKIGNTEVVNTWTNPNGSTTGTFDMEPNREYDFHAIQFERGGSASARSILRWATLTPETQTATMSVEKSVAEIKYEVVSPENFIAPDIMNAEIDLLVFGEDRSSDVSKLKSLGYNVRYSDDINYFSTLDLNAFDQVWYVDYKVVPNNQGTENLRDYLQNGGKVFFAGENFNKTTRIYSLWRDSLLNALGANGIKQSQTINPVRIGYFYTNPEHILSSSPFMVDSIKHLSEGNGTFETVGDGTAIAGTDPGGQGYPIAVAFDYGELSLAPNSRVVVYLNSNNGENWDMYVENVAEYLKQEKSETILAVQDSYGIPGSIGNVSVNLENAEDIAGAQFTLTDVPDNLTATAVNTTDRSSGFTVGFNENNSGALKVILYNTEGKVIQPGDGPILEINYNISSDAVAGESSQLQLSQVLLSDSDGVSIPVVPQNGNFYFNASKGDVNGDGVVDIIDLIRAINIFFGNLPEPTEQEFFAADFNSDENVDILDIVQIVHYILDNPQQNPSLAVKSLGENTIWIENTSLESGQNIEIPVMADFSEKVAGLQLRFSYDPQSITLGEPVTAPRSSGLNVNSRITGGELVVLMYSLDGNVIQPGEGPVLYIPAILTNNATAGSGLRLEEVTLVDPLAGKIPVGITTDLNENAGMPSDFVLYQNYPNPFRSQTRFEYGLPRSADISIKVHNSLGQVVRELISAKIQAGFYTVSWDGKNDKGLSVPPGIYFYQLNADGDFISRKKMIVLK